MANTRSQQTTLVNTNLADNTTEQITPLKHREVETESITASAFVDDDNTFTGSNSFANHIVVQDGWLFMPTDLVQIGGGAGSSNTGTACNQIGNTAGNNNSGNNCNQIGVAAGRLNTGDSCNQIGNDAGRENSGNYCNQIGIQAGIQNTGNECNQIGFQAGQDNTGNECNQIGFQAGIQNTGNECNQIGFQAGRLNTGNDCNMFGSSAGNKNTKDGGVFIGPSAGFNSNTGYTGVDAVFAIANASIPEFPNKTDAETAITTANGYPTGSTYIYRNNQHGWIGYVTL